MSVLRYHLDPCGNQTDGAACHGTLANVRAGEWLESSLEIACGTEAGLACLVLPVR